MDCLAIRLLEIDNHSKNNNNIAVENFPICCLHVYEKITSPCRLKIEGLYVRGEESAEYDLASITAITNNKFQVYDDDQQDPYIDEMSMFYIYIYIYIVT